MFYMLGEKAEDLAAEVLVTETRLEKVFILPNIHFQFNYNCFQFQ